MNKKISKTLVLGVIFIFLGVAFAPSFSAYDEKYSKIKTNSLDNMTIKFNVIEFKPDGTQESNIIDLTFENAEKLQSEFKKTTTAEERLEVYKDYGFIPKNVTLEKLKLGMEEKANKMGLNEERLEKISENFPLIPFFNYHKRDIICSIYGGMSAGFRFIIGSSAITRIINIYVYNRLHRDLGDDVPSIDLFTTLCGLFGGTIARNGLLPDIEFLGIGIFVMLGFVGFYVSANNIFGLLPFLLYEDVFIGYTAYTEVAGFNLWY